MAELVISRESLHISVHDPVANSMNFLNEIAGRYPEAISLAAGRPYEDFYDLADVARFQSAYAAHLQRLGHTPQQIRRTFMQYGATNGQINDLIAQLLATDEDIVVSPEAIAVTVGCQEAMVIVLRGLCAGPHDVLLAVSPCYVGITGAARLLGVEVIGVPETAAGVAPEAVAQAARHARAAGKNPRAFYVVPDFANPSGTCLTLTVRRELLAVAEAEDLLILEDDPYSLFGADDAPRPRLKALDTAQRVIYLGSFAKSCFPGARVGYLVADQIVVDESGQRTLLAQELSAIKSMLTVNTAPIAQAVVAGLLLESGCSLRKANVDKIAFYRENLRVLLAALDRHMPSRVRWNAPSGGFFAVLEVPFPADLALLQRSASDYGVLWTPMSFFYPAGEGGGHAIRLACSYLDPATIAEGVRRLAALIRDIS